MKELYRLAAEFEDEPIPPTLPSGMLPITPTKDISQYVSEVESKPPLDSEALPYHEKSPPSASHKELYLQHILELMHAFSIITPAYYNMAKEDLSSAEGMMQVEQGLRAALLQADIELTNYLKVLNRIRGLLHKL